MSEKCSKSIVARKAEKKSYWQLIQIMWLTCLFLGLIVLLAGFQPSPNGDLDPPVPIKIGVISSPQSTGVITKSIVDEWVSNHVVESY